MAAVEGAFSFSVASVVEDVLQQHENRSHDLDFDARRAEEAAMRRYEAAAWLRKVVGVVVARDLPAEPSEEEFRLGLRSGIILCNLLNKIQHGAVLKVVESPCDTALIPDGAALSAYQYFENVRNFLVAVQEMGMPAFEASDLEQPSSSLSKLVRTILLDKKPEEVPNLVESVLSKVMEGFERHVSSQIGLKDNSRGQNISHSSTSMIKPPSANQQNAAIPNEDLEKKITICDKESDRSLMKQQLIVNQQQKDIKVLKHTLSTTKAGVQYMQMKFNEEIHNLGLHVHGLAYAASGYHRVLEENRKLYNEVQDLKGSIRVYCSVRPFLPGQNNYLSTVDYIEEGVITINTLAKNGKVRKSFNFNKVFRPSATQEEVFSDTQPLVRSVLDGYNVCIFAYGQTGSGKTFTMSGPKDLTEKSQGVNYRALSDLFILAEQRKETFFYDVSVQMIEIYNEQVRDLLVTNGLNKRLEIRNSSQTGLSVPDANLVHVSSTSDVIELMNIGQRNRAVGATALNDRSNRSHSCLTVHVQGKNLTSGTILRGCMHLVDLAGSERVDKSEVTGDRLKEAQHINRSLSALGDLVSCSKELTCPLQK